MPTLGNLPAPPPNVINSDRDASIAYPVVNGGIVAPLNDTVNAEKGKIPPPFYVKKTEGYSIYSDLSSFGVVGGGNGFVVHKHADITKLDRSHKISCFGNKIFLTNDGKTSLLRDVNTEDGFTIEFASMVSVKRYVYIAIGDSSMSGQLYRYGGSDTTGPITAVADVGGGKVKITSTAHGLEDGDIITITGTTSYNGEFTISNKTSNDFEIVSSFVATETGTWTGRPKIGSPITETGMNAGRIVELMDNRLVISGTGLNSIEVQYSKVSALGNFTDFTGVGLPDDGGSLSGNLGSSTAIKYHRGFTFVFEQDKITLHKINRPLTDGSSLIKDSKTLQEGQTLDAFGVESPKSVTLGKKSIFWVDPSNGIYTYDFSKQSEIELTVNFREEILKYDLSDSSICYDRSRDLLLVTASSVKGIPADTILIYSFLTGGWSIDSGKSVNHLYYDEIDKQVYGLSSNSPEIHHVFDGTYNNNGNEIELSVKTRLYDFGRRSKLKEYQESSCVLGYTNGVEEFTYRVLVDDITTPEVEEVISLTGTGTSNTASPVGTVGEYLFGAGGASEELLRYTFKQHLNEDSIQDFKRCYVSITEKSFFNSAIYKPEIIAQITDDTAEETTLKSS